MSIAFILTGGLILEALGKAALSICNQPRRVVTGGKR